VLGEAADLVGEPGGARDDPHAFAEQPLADVGGLGHRQALDPVVDRREIEVDGGQLRALEAERRRVADRGHGAGGGDEGLRRDAVGEHAGATQPVPLDDGDLGPELCGDQGGLVAGRSPADDHDAGHGSPVQSGRSASIVPGR
jgi:hypothetical protein